MHAVTQEIPSFLALEGRLQVRVVPAASDNLVWLVTCTETGDTAIVDGPSAAEVLEVVDREGLRVVAVWTTHTHGDHVGLHHDLIRQGRLPAEVIGSADADGGVPGLTRAVRDGDRVRLGAVTAEVWAVEGHQRGHLAFVFPGEDGVIFCGDTLFTAGCGRMFAGPASAFFASLMRIAALPGGMRVCCAHEYTADGLRFAATMEPDNEALALRGAAVAARRAAGACCVPSMLAEEQATNPFLRPGSPSLRESLRAQVPGVDLSDWTAVFAATRALKDTGAYKAVSPPWEVPGA